MDLDWASIARYCIAAVPALVAVIGLARGPGALRSALRHDAELLDMLPAGSAPHDSLLEHIDEQVRRLAKFDLESSRDWGSFFIATVLSTLFAIATVWAAGQGGWWFFGAAILGVVTLAAAATIPDYAE